MERSTRKGASVIGIPCWPISRTSISDPYVGLVGDWRPIRLHRTVCQRPSVPLRQKKLSYTCQHSGNLSFWCYFKKSLSPFSASPRFHIAICLNDHTNWKNKKERENLSGKWRSVFLGHVHIHPEPEETPVHGDLRSPSNSFLDSCHNIRS